MCDEYEYDSDPDEDTFMEVEIGRMRNRGDKFERLGRNDIGDEVDGA